MIFCAITLVSCISDDDLSPSQAEVCEDYPPPLGITAWEWRKQYPYYYYPTVKPNSSSEILFCEDDKVDDVHSSILYKYDLLSRDKTVVYEGRIGPRPRWNQYDWVLISLFDGVNFDIFKIKSNGDSLTQLTFTGNCFFPEWDKMGKKIIYELGYTSPTTHIIMDEWGNPLDTTLVGVGVGGSWQHDSLVVNGNFRGLFVGNPYSGVYDFRMLSDVEPSPQSAGGAAWLDHPNIFWVHTTGIYSTSLESNETVTLKETCNTDYYELPVYLQATDQIILQRKRKHVVTHERDNNTGTSTSELYIMAPDGTGQRRIDIH